LCCPSCALRWYRCILAEHGGIHKGPLPAVMLDLCGRPLSWIHTWGRGGGTNGQPARTVKAMEKRHGMPYSRSPKNPTLQQLQESSKSASTAVLPKIPHSNSCKRVPSRPLRPRRGRFGTILRQLECGIFGRTAVRPRRGRFGTLLGQLQCGIFQKTAVPGVRRLMCHLEFQNTNSYGCDALVPQAAHGKINQYLWRVTIESSFFVARHILS